MLHVIHVQSANSLHHLYNLLSFTSNYPCYSLSSLGKEKLRSVYFICFEIVWQWNVPTAQGVMSKGLFLANRYFLNKGAGSIGMASVFDGEQATKFQPVFAIFQWPARAKVAHLKHSTVILQLNHCQRVAAQVDPNQMSCHPFALLDTTNNSCSPTSQLPKIIWFWSS